MSPADGPARGSGPIVTACPKCLADTVRPLTLAWVADGVQYWACDRCGLVWGYCDGQDLRTIGADRRHKQSA